MQELAGAIALVLVAWLVWLNYLSPEARERRRWLDETVANSERWRRLRAADPERAERLSDLAERAEYNEDADRCFRAEWSAVQRELG